MLLKYFFDENGFILPDHEAIKLEALKRKKHELRHVKFTFADIENVHRHAIDKRLPRAEKDKKLNV